MSFQITARRDEERILLEFHDQVYVLTVREASDLRHALWTALYADANGHTQPIRFPSSPVLAEDCL